MPGFDRHNREFLPPLAQMAFNIRGEQSPEDVAPALAGALGIRLADEPAGRDYIEDRLTDGAVRVLWQLVEPLNVALAQGTVPLETRAPGIAERAVRGLDLIEIVDAMTDFGWGKQWIPPKTEMRALRRVASRQLVKHLTDRVHATLRRWEKNGTLIERPAPAPIGEAAR